MPKSIEQLRRDAKALRRAYEALDTNARARVEAILRSTNAPPKHADFLRVIAPVTGYQEQAEAVRCGAMSVASSPSFTFPEREP